MNQYFGIYQQPIHGTLSGLNQTTGEVTYTKPSGYYGLDFYMLEIRCGNTFETSRTTRTIEFYVENKLCAEAIDDNVGNLAIGVNANIDVSTNDILCTGLVTWRLSPTVTPTNVTINAFSNTGTVSFTPIATGAFSFTYEILCNGTVHDTGTVSGTGICGPVFGGIINGNLQTVKGKIETYTVSDVNNSPPFTYNWIIPDAVILSGQGTNTVTVQWL